MMQVYTTQMLTENKKGEHVN